MSKVNIVNKDDQTGVWVSKQLKPRRRKKKFEVLLFYLPEEKYVELFALNA